MRNFIIAPSILSCDFLNIEKELEFFHGEKDLWIHLDIMDGHFVPNLTFGIPIVQQISKFSKNHLDAHLMVDNPRFHIDEMKDFGLHNITFHYEAVSDSLGLINHAKKYYPSVGVSIKPGTNVDELSDEILQALDLVLVMSVEPGFGGQSFIENSYNKIKELSARRENMNLDFQIQVDGGVSEKNSKQLRDCGADNLVAGSFIFKKDPSDYTKTVSLLR